MYFGGEIIYNPNGNADADSVRFRYKIVDSEGFVVVSVSEYTPSLCVGDKFKDYASAPWPAAYNLNPNETYTVIIMQE